MRLEASEEKTADGLRPTVAGAVWGRTLACAGVRIRGPCAACLGSASQHPNVPPLRLLSVVAHVPLAHQQCRPQLPSAKAAEALAAAALLLKLFLTLLTALNTLSGSARVSSTLEMSDVGLS